MDLVEKLFHQRIGVENNDDLWDDVSKYKIDKLLENQNFVRKIEISEKRGGGVIPDQSKINLGSSLFMKTNIIQTAKPQPIPTGKTTTILFSKNHAEDKTDQHYLQKSVPEKLKFYWKSIDDE